MIKNYEEMVYAGILGKVIGVYMGRPVEGWLKENIQKTVGTVDRYVNKELKKDLVVADDDISGTLTFIRILEDSGLYEKTPVERFGDNWLNYISHNKTILWWGGAGISTEHTAYLRLLHGYKAPDSGSAKLNGKMVAEQIGAQIFIDAFGLVAPGKPEIAVDLARKAASVSHDGEAVYGAIMVAAMVSAAFLEKDMNRLFDVGLSFIPKDSIIAQIYRDVRKWHKENENWEVTYEKIREKYGYDKYSGNCHIVPNHALMVMAWLYGADSFLKSQEIIITAGWDTDCNAGNVGTVMGIRLGLKGIIEEYDFQSPFADRIVIPNAEGTRSITDCLNEAIEIAKVGRKIMGWNSVPKYKNGAIHHFSLPGALHGYRVENPEKHQNDVVIRNVPFRESRGMLVEAGHLAETVTVSTPIYMIEEDSNNYNFFGTPRVYSGMKVTMKFETGSEISENTCINLFLRTCEWETRTASKIIEGESIKLKPNQEYNLEIEIPDTEGWPIVSFGFNLRGGNGNKAKMVVDSVSFSGKPNIYIPKSIPQMHTGTICGWIADTDNTWNVLHSARTDLQFFGKNRGRGILATGTKDWTDYTLEANLLIHCADEAGIVVRYQGLRRFIALIKERDSIKLVKVLYEESIIDERRLIWDIDTIYPVKMTAIGNKIDIYLQNQQIFSHTEPDLDCGGIGFLVKNGNAAFNELRMTGL